MISAILETIGMVTPGLMILDSSIPVPPRSPVKNISASILADSISRDGHRITTFELEYPRFIHAEFMTHRLFSRNAASSRAIPVKTQLQNIRDNTAHPIHWGANQAGMQAREESDNLVNGMKAKEAWKEAAKEAARWAEEFDSAGYHKQIVNRLTEPFSRIKVVCTATEYDNFFWLRRHPAAQPEIQELANQMFDVRQESKPRLLEENEWHLPYVDDSIKDDVENYLLSNSSDEIKSAEDLLLRISASCCAQVSYRKNDTSIEKALKLFNQLVPSMNSTSPVHASPFEHQATPILPTHNFKYPGITHTCHRDGSRWSGNFRWWIQYRQLIPGHAKWNL